MKIIYYGTPEFAVPSLDILVRNGYTIVAVVTAPDKPSGRGLKLTSSPVKQYALAKGLKVLQPEKLKDPAFMEELEKLKPDLQVVVAFRMMPEAVWKLPPLGTFNLHGSLLPQYRGAAPINRAIINGEKETGVTTFFLKQEVDTGNILFREKITIGEEETAGELHDRMKLTGAELVLKTVRAIESGNYRETEQQSLAGQPLKAAPKIFRDDCRISWKKDVDTIFNLVRGLSPYPGAWTMIASASEPQQLKIYKAKKEISSHALVPGTLVTDHRTFIKIAAGNGFIYPEQLQLAGKNKMNVEEFLRGMKSRKWEVRSEK